MASLVKQSGGYYAQFYHKDRTPARKKISLKTSRKSDAQRLLSKLEVDYHRGDFCPWTDDPLTYDREIAEEPLSLEEALARFVEEKEEEGYSHHTIKTYRKVIRRVMQEASPEKRVDQLTHKEINAYVRQEGVAQATKDRRFRHSALLSIGL